MRFSAQMAMVSFKDDDEMLSFKADFTAALAFIGKLDDVDTKGVEPLGNVLEYYGGNEEKLRTMEDF
jgi:Asp-tRNA(Asn)/Glu-tRNA(Gln) amidotransferase C subunit